MVSVVPERKKMPLDRREKNAHPVRLLLFASLAFISIADSVPKFDMATECRTEGGSKAVLARCAEDEAAARDQLPQSWIQSGAADKATCIRETSTDGPPSYVELLMCLEMSRDAEVTTPALR